MAVAFDAQISAAITGAGTSFTDSTSMTVGSGANRALLVAVIWDTTITVPSITWNGVALTLLASQIASGSASQVAIFGLRNPASGTHTLAGSWTGSFGDFDVGAVSFTGVDQSSDANAFQNANSAAATVSPASVTVTSASGDMVVAAFGVNNGFNGNGFTSVSSNIIFNVINSDAVGAGDYAAGASSVTLSAAYGFGIGNAAAGISVHAAGGGAVSATQPRTPYVTKLPPFPFSAAPPQAYNLNLYSVVVVNTPFNQTDFPKAFDIPLRPFPLDQALNINLFTNPYPFNQVDWSKPIKLPQAPVNPDQSLNVNVFAVVPTPFIPIDWNKPFVPKFPPTIDQALNVNLFTNPIPVLNLDLFTPIRTKGFPDTSQAYNVNLYGVVVVQVPFNQIDWAKPFVPRPAPMRDQLFNPNVSTNPLPFNQFDFNIKPLRTPQAPVNPDQSLNINLFTNQYPFLNVFGLSTKVAGLVPPPQPYNQNIYTVVVTVLPFNTYDYPRAARLPRAPYDLSVQVNPNLFTNPFPFNQYDWAKAVRVKNVHSQPPYNQGLYNVVVTATLHVVRFIGNVGSMLVR